MEKRDNNLKAVLLTNMKDTVLEVIKSHQGTDDIDIRIPNQTQVRTINKNLLGPQGFKALLAEKITKGNGQDVFFTVGEKSDTNRSGVTWFTETGVYE